MFPKLLPEWNVKHITYENEIEPYAQQSYINLKKIAQRHGIELSGLNSNNLYDFKKVLELNEGKPPTTYQKFLSLAAKLTVPKPIKTFVRNDAQKHFSRVNSLITRKEPTLDSSEQRDNTCYDIPSMDEMPVNTDDLGPVLHPGGEDEAMRRMYKALEDEQWIANFKKPETEPNSLEPSTTVLSPYIAFGCLSSRVFYHELQEVLKRHRKHSEPPVSLVGQLMWREFFYTAGFSEPNFDKMTGNTLCRQISWNHDDEVVTMWANGQTGYPFIDAIMRQLRQEGWIHHLARHAVACFLTRGDLWQSWEKGEQVFRKLLLDADWAINAGNWLWLSASGFYYQYFRVYSPIAFGKKTDPNGDYIRKYCPELKDYPRRFIYEPWEATQKEQKEFKCILGKDYPHRIAIHEVVKDINMNRMARAYRKHNANENSDDSDPEQEYKPKVKVQVKSERGSAVPIHPLPALKKEADDTKRTRIKRER